MRKYKYRAMSGNGKIVSGELDAAGGLSSSFFISISPAAFAVNKKKKAMEHFHLSLIHI